MEFPKWREAGEIGNNYAILRNISQSKKRKDAGANNNGAGTGIKGYGKGEVQSPLCPHWREAGEIGNNYAIFHNRGGIFKPPCRPLS